MLLWHVLGWATVVGGSLLAGSCVWFTAGGWRRFQWPLPIPKLALVTTAPDPIPGFNEYVGAV